VPLPKPWQGGCTGRTRDPPRCTTPETCVLTWVWGAKNRITPLSCRSRDCESEIPPSGGRVDDRLWVAAGWDEPRKNGRSQKPRRRSATHRQGLTNVTGRSWKRILEKHPLICPVLPTFCRFCAEFFEKTESQGQDRNRINPPHTLQAAGRGSNRRAAGEGPQGVCRCAETREQTRGGGRTRKLCHRTLRRASDAYVALCASPSCAVPRSWVRR
jgi:hypothetical protein